MTKFVKVDLDKYEIFANNDVKIGEALMTEDGFFNFFPEQNNGYWPPHLLRSIADELDKINKPWEDQINKYFEEHK